MVGTCLIRDTEEAKICLLQILGQGNGITREFNDDRVIVRLSEGNRGTGRVNVVIHRVRILDDRIETEGADLGMAVDLHVSEAVCRGAEIIREMTRFNLKLSRKTCLTALCRNLVGGHAALYLCLVVIRNIGTVREAVVIGAKLIRKPALILSRSPLPVHVTAPVVVVIFLLEHLYAGNILLVSRRIGIRKGIIRDAGSVDNGLGDGLPRIADALRRVGRILIPRYQGSHFHLPGHRILDIEPIAESVLFLESQVIQINR